MARTTGPLFSQDASGTVAGTITHSKWKGRNYVRSTVTPANPKSQLQVSSRVMLGWLANQWNGQPIPDARKATWEALAQKGGVSPYNAYLTYNLHRWTQSLGPTTIYPQNNAETESQVTVTHPLAAGAIRHAIISWTITSVLQGWGIMGFRVPGPTIIATHDNLVFITPSLALGAHTYLDGPLEPGQYSYRFWLFSTSNRIDKKMLTHTVTVLP